MSLSTSVMALVEDEKTYYVSPSLQHVYEHVCLYLFSLSHPWSHNQRHHRPRNNLPCGASVRGSLWTLACKTSRSQDIFRKLGAHRWSGDQYKAVIRGEPISLCFGFRMGGGHEFLTKNSAQIIWTKTFGPLLWLSITERSCIHPNMLGGVAYSICAIDREDFMLYWIWAMSFQAKWSSEVALSVIFKDKVVEHFHF